MPRSYLAALAGVLIVSACSSNDTGGGNSRSVPPSRVDESKALGSLTPAEQKTLCEDVVALTSALTDAAYIAGFCRYSAISSASLNASVQHLTLDQMRQDCQNLEGQCHTQQGMAMQMPSSRGCAYPTGCAATVGDLRGCTVGRFEGSSKVYASLPSCDQMEMDTVSKIDNSPISNSASACSGVVACGPPQ
jgi:hypothetical protein